MNTVKYLTEAGADIRVAEFYSLNTLVYISSMNVSISTVI